MLGKEHKTFQCPVLDVDGNLTVVAHGLVEYRVHKGLTARMWNKVLTFGITNVFDADKTKAFEHKVQLRIKCRKHMVATREKYSIEVSEEEANKFIKMFANLNQLETLLHVVKPAIEGGDAEVDVRAEVVGGELVGGAGDHKGKKHGHKDIVPSNLLQSIVRGGALGGIPVAANLWAANVVAGGAQGWTGAVASAVPTITLSAGVGLTVAAVGYQSYQILKGYNDGTLTGAEAGRASARLVSTTGLSIGAGAGAAFLCATPVGAMVVGCILIISVALGDHFLGDKLWSVFIQDDPTAVEAQQKRNYKELLAEIVIAAYKLLGLTKYATDDEIREAKRYCLLKYHPDKGGDKDKFLAVHAALEIIRYHRSGVYQ